MSGAMLYDLRLKVAADYPGSVNEARHVLRMRLRAMADQEVVSQVLRITPRPDEAREATDFFGNPCDHIAILKGHETLEADLAARVRVARRKADLGRAPPLSSLRDMGAAHRSAGPLSPIHFRGPSRLLAPNAALADFAEPFAEIAGAGNLVLAMTREIFAGFSYASGETGIDTPVTDVLATRRGVCQDFAHLMILALRSLGIPAAYVSGFLRTDPPPGRPRLAGADAMHAWVAAWLGPDLGWVQFDPTNGVPANNDHLVVALGRDYADVAPMGGVVVTSGGQETRHEVDVVPVEAEEG